jgi:hypothetical protein
MQTAANIWIAVLPGEGVPLSIRRMMYQIE